MNSGLVISLDFELFWGVADSTSIARYRDNVEGEWTAIPRMLEIFKRYKVQATWATVGMLMCHNYKHWCEMRPAILPSYLRRHLSTYMLGTVVRDNPKLFFALPLVKRILETPGQELATHTYSHFYCGEDGVTPEQFVADLECAQRIAKELGVHQRSLVFPRNQMPFEFVAALRHVGVDCYRGNPNHWIYRSGHHTPAGIAGRAARFADAWLPISGNQCSRQEVVCGVVNVPASLFLRPWSSYLSGLEPLRLMRLKRSMTYAARTGRICHLWWHPHNFGVNLEQNLSVLEALLKHFLTLKDQYGMSSMNMGTAADVHQSYGASAGEQHAFN